MKIKSLRLIALRNEEHAEFMNVFKGKLSVSAATWVVLIPLITEFDVRYNCKSQIIRGQISANLAGGIPPVPWCGFW